MKLLESEQSHAVARSQLLKNSLTMAVSRVAGVATMLLSVPIIVARLGQDGFGVWECLTALSGITLAFQMVISSTLTWRMSHCYGEGDTGEIKRLVRVGVGLSIALAILLFLAASASSDLLVSQLQIEGEWRRRFQIVFPAVVLIAAMGGVNETLLAVCAAHQKAGVAAIIQACSLVGANLIAIVAVLNGVSILAIAYGQLAGFAITFFVGYRIARSLCGSLSILPTWPLRKDFRSMGPYVVLVLVSNLTLIFRDHIDRLFVAHLESPTIAGYLGIARTLSSSVGLICGFIAMPLAASIGYLCGKKDVEASMKLFADSSLWIGLLTGLLAFLVCCLHRVIFIFWMGKDQPESYSFLAVQLFGIAAATAFSGAAAAMSKGSGRPSIETKACLAALALNIITKPFLIALLGPLGTVVASSISWAIGAVILLFLLQRALRFPWEIISRSFAIFFLSLVLCCVGWFLGGMCTGQITTRASAFLFLIFGVPILTVAFAIIFVVLDFIKLDFVLLSGQSFLKKCSFRTH